MRFDDRLFDGLARMVSEEPVRTRDLVAMNQIYPLGIGKGRTFEPDRATREILKESAQEVQSGLLEGSVTGEPLEPMGHWIRSATISSKTGLTHETAARFGIDPRNVEYFMAFEDLKGRQSLLARRRSFLRCRTAAAARRENLQVTHSSQSGCGTELGSRGL